MNAEYLKKFNEADKKVHLVEDQWHYPIMIKYGFTPVTKTGIGFVRAYEYVHPSGHKVSVCTGYSANYFTGISPKGWGYCGDLEPFLKKICSG